MFPLPSSLIAQESISLKPKTAYELLETEGGGKEPRWVLRTTGLKSRPCSASGPLCDPGQTMELLPDSAFLSGEWE